MQPTLSFRLIHGCYQDASSRNDSDVDFLLEENSSWDDFGFHTSFFLHATTKLTGAGIKALGYISIMCVDRNINEWDALLLINKIGYEKKFYELPPDFCSLSTSLNLYKQLHRYLTQKQRRAFEKSFNMILDSDSPYYQKVSHTDCFNKSLLRDTDIGDYALIFGKEKLRENSRQYELRSKGFTVKYDNCDDEITLDFSPIKIKDEKGIFPNGIISFIGKNGSGKSTFLYRLATELFASAINRKIKIIPEDIVVSQLMLFSYSPFDDFILPIQCNEQSLKKWYFDFQKFKETKNEAFKPRFIYCGIRDIEHELNEIINAGENSFFDETGNYKEGDRLGKTFLVDTTKMSNECRIAIEAAQDKFGKDWETFIANLYQAIPELIPTIDYLNDRACLVFEEAKWNECFKKLSTGHKFFLHAMSCLIAYCEENAVIMFDEPENHLQAPLLSFMMKEIGRILARRSSVMLVATHSPVILQETLSSNVRVVRRSEENVIIQKPEIETYGASFGAISSYVFGLTVDNVSYFDVLRSIFEHEKCRDKASVKEAVDAVSDCLGNISDVAIRYIVQLYLEPRGSEHVAST